MQIQLGSLLAPTLPPNKIRRPSVPFALCGLLTLAGQIFIWENCRAAISRK